MDIMVLEQQEMAATVVKGSQCLPGLNDTQETRIRELTIIAIQTCLEQTQGAVD
jgi:hypothetical protein